MRLRLVVIPTVIALLAGAAVATAAGSGSRYVAISTYEEKGVARTDALRYVLRTRYIAPGSWRLASARRGTTTRRFGPVGSCRFRITVTSRSVADADEPAVRRVTRLLPVTGRYLRDDGTHGNAAWRVTRATGSDKVTGMLVKPASTVRTQPPGKRVWLELRAVGRPDPRTECHSGGPRSVAAGFATILATGSLGGFQPR